MGTKLGWKWVAALLVVVAGLAAGSLPAQAHGVRGGVYLNLGVPWPYWGPRYYDPYYWGPPPIYTPAPVVIQRTEPVYVEREVPAPAAAAPRVEEAVWWYWCASARGYYPYVKDCPGGFQRVPPQPVPAK